MANIALPVAGTEVNASAFGVPVVQALNRTGGTWRRAANQSIPSGAWTLLIFDTEVADTNGFATPPASAFTVPAGCDGLYSVTVNAYIGYGAGFVSTVSLLISGITENMTSVSDGVTGTATLSVTAPLAVGGQVFARIYQNSGSAVPSVGRLDIWRVGL